MATRGNSSRLRKVPTSAPTAAQPVSRPTTSGTDAASNVTREKASAKPSAMLPPIAQETPELIAAWKALADHTRAKCGTPHCRVIPELRPHRCCDRQYCVMAKEYAKDRYGIELQPTGHPDLPFMGPNGCTVEPYLRPICSLHQCSINSMGVLRGDPSWTVEYFRLRETIDILELARQPS
jgi:hypothetical protein